MRGLIFAAIIIVLILALFCAWVYIQMGKGAAKAAPEGVSDWQVELIESESHPITTVFIRRFKLNGKGKPLAFAGSERWTSIDRLDDDYEQKLWEAKASAQDECDDRNSLQKALDESS